MFSETLQFLTMIPRDLAWVREILIPEKSLAPNGADCPEQRKHVRLF